MNIKIEVPIKVGDLVWCIDRDRVVSCEITGYDITIELHKGFRPIQTIELALRNGAVNFGKNIKDCFKTKEDLIKSL